jgi:nitrogen fixation protein FixH
VKAGASVLLAQEKGGLPVLAVQNYGQGRVAGFTSGGSWYWQVSRPASDEFHEKFWKQLIRWLAVGAKQRLTVETDADVYARGKPVIVKATVCEKDLRPVSDAAVVATLTNPAGNSEDVPMDWILSQDGVYQCRYLAPEEGTYTVSVKVQGWDLPPAKAGFEVSEPYIEYSNAGLKEDLLRGMAKMTGGRYFTVTEAPGLVEAIARNVIGLMAAEWFVRRRRGLA